MYMHIIIPVADAGFQKGGSRKKVRAEILAMPPQHQPQSMHVHTKLNAASAILWQVHMLLSRSLSNYLSSLLVYSSATQLA